jgi:hypothetical protein
MPAIVLRSSFRLQLSVVSRQLSVKKNEAKSVAGNEFLASFLAER